jgi:hypothetical protein
VTQVFGKFPYGGVYRKLPKTQAEIHSAARAFFPALIAPSRSGIESFLLPMAFSRVNGSGIQRPHGDQIRNPLSSIFPSIAPSGRPATVASITVGRALKGKPAVSSAPLSGALNSLKARGAQEGEIQ